MARQVGAFSAHIVLELRYPRRTALLADCQAFVWLSTVELALDLEEGVDPFYRLPGQRLDRSGLPSEPALRCYVGKLKELATGMHPAQRPDDRTCCTIGNVELIVAVIGAGLQDAAEVCQMVFGMFASLVARLAEQCGRRRTHRSRPGRWSSLASPMPAPWCRRHAGVRPQSLGLRSARAGAVVRRRRRPLDPPASGWTGRHPRGHRSACRFSG